MNVRLLTILADFLDQLPSDQFDLHTWLETGNLNDKAVAELTVAEMLAEKDCGTTACAIGWACTIPEFQEAGLKYHYDYDGIYVGQPPADGVTDGSTIQQVARLLDLTIFQANHLFMPHYYTDWDCVTPKGVADKIRLLMSSEGCENA